MNRRRRRSARGGQRSAENKAGKTTIVLTGGGSGGHVTPLLAVAAELKRRDKTLHLIYVGQRGDPFADMPKDDPNIDENYAVSAGKFRRYHGEGFKQLLDFPTMFKNLRDLFRVLAGIWQSRRLMGRLQPDAVFSRGGFVSVPVCLGAALRGIPYITHDSDPVPSLANRLIAPWAKLHAVAMPAESYPYKPAKTVTTGIPLNKSFKPVTPELRERYRRAIGMPANAKMLFIIGGGLGSEKVNRAVLDCLPHLMRDFVDLRVVHVAGRSHESEMVKAYDEELTAEQRGRAAVSGFIPDVYMYSGAADIVICRAGATNLAEFALQGKACVVLPSPFLAGGHQLANARYLAEQGAIVAINEEDLADDPNRLAKQLARLLHDPAEVKALGAKFAAFGRQDAASAIAKLIIGLT
jgi:UDP-N-acetylglucosamine--N-acetylmuramyl-(pentapeptide) pyrophosphoryl-undecaprenol N-acetylglucosamine transferase